MRAWLLAGGILLGGLFLSMLQGALSHTSAVDGVYSIDNQETAFSFPLKILSTPEGDVPVSFTLHVNSIRPSRYYILLDDCLKIFTINGKEVNDPAVPFCDYIHGRTLNLSRYLQTGDNSVTMLLHNNVGDVSLLIRPSFTDPVAFLPYFLFLIAVICAGVVLVKMLRIPSWATGTGILLFVGILVRIVYMMTSPYTVRNHDAEAHLEYIQYLQTHGSIPMPNAGWEFWQPPLYYFLGSLWMHIASFLHLQNGQTMMGLQMGALLFSIASLLLCAWIAWMVLPDKAKPLGMPLFCSLLIFFPGLILQASQINNDTLSIVLAIAAFAVLVYWWKMPKPTLRVWLGLSLIISLGFLTKSTAILILAVTFASLFFRKGMTWQKKFGLGLTSLLVVALVSGWFTAYRIVQNTGQSYIAGNTNTLNSGLAIPNSPSMYVTFNPVAMLRIPYNSPWDDAARRQYFWEYWYRSAFFGEFNFGDSLKVVASWILFFSYIMTVLLFFGVWKMLRTRLYESIPFFFLLLFLAAGAMLYRVQYPFTPSEDFRFTLGILAAAAYFCTMGILHVKWPLLRYISIISAILFVGFSGIFMISLNIV